MARINNGILGGMHGNADPVKAYIKYGVALLSGKKRKRIAISPCIRHPSLYARYIHVYGNYPVGYIAIPSKLVN
ncbi:hypothetical protein [Pedobacter hiemivivus]|uniref:Uncharacterized protein n=1 Tax=Pedobacter hiemivivus TaxID=2530454 RepID=A0A4R0MUY6_9SPHI|nr:hypothetical protein [Pedobacter hiemivivus]TCC90968.1 hypothetical protein EZ444_19820 [Pedobacter hiemivivus]